MSLNNTTRNKNNVATARKAQPGTFQLATITSKVEAWEAQNPEKMQAVERYLANMLGNRGYQNSGKSWIKRRGGRHVIATVIRDLRDIGFTSFYNQHRPNKESTVESMLEMLYDASQRPLPSHTHMNEQEAYMMSFELNRDNEEYYGGKPKRKLSATSATKKKRSTATSDTKRKSTTTSGIKKKRSTATSATKKKVSKK